MVKLFIIFLFHLFQIFWNLTLRNAQDQDRNAQDQDRNAQDQDRKATKFFNTSS